MSNTKFTKGEWVVVDKSQDSNPFDKVTVNNTVKMPSSQKTKYGACFCAAIGGFDVHTQKDEAEANAHLIAAAPEMYEMLESVFCIEHERGGSIGSDGSFYYKVIEDVFKSIGKLLAKARGVVI